jgi:hypothetical protein
MSLDENVFSKAIGTGMRKHPVKNSKRTPKECEFTFGDTDIATNFPHNLIDGQRCNKGIDPSYVGPAHKQWLDNMKNRNYSPPPTALLMSPIDQAQTHAELKGLKNLIIDDFKPVIHAAFVTFAQNNKLKDLEQLVSSFPAYIRAYKQITDVGIQSSYKQGPFGDPKLKDYYARELMTLRNIKYRGDAKDGFISKLFSKALEQVRRALKGSASITKAREKDASGKPIRNKGSKQTQVFNEQNKSRKRVGDGSEIERVASRRCKPLHVREVNNPCQYLEEGGTILLDGQGYKDLLLKIPQDDRYVFCHIEREKLWQN